MDAKSLGENIARLRKKHGFTQAGLASKLNISDKAVSKWESGQGFPEITQIPALAKLLHVSIDYLMTGERRGIVLAGNILTDVVKDVDCYPEIGMLANIYGMTRSVGGCVPNTGIDLAKIDRSIPLGVVGRIGDDEYGRFVLSQLQQHGIDTGRVTVSQTAPTSFSDVINLPTGERTFFHQRGANAEFCPEDVDLTSLNCSILHTGYILLLDQFDREDPEYGTVMAHFLHDVQERGIRTSIDVVSDSTAEYGKKIIPALRYCNYAVMNEIESCSIWGLPPRYEDGRLHIENIRRTMERMLACGVKDKVIVHCKEAGFVLSSNAEFTMLGSLRIPKTEIKGSVGAGDAFCAGCLYGIYHEYSDMDILRFASSAAACSLFAENSVDGMKSKNDILQLEEKYGRITLE